VLGTFFRQIKAGLDIDIYEDGQMKRDFVYIEDVVEALYRAGANEQAFDKTLNVGTGVFVTLEDAGREMFRLFGEQPRLSFSGKYRLGDIHHAFADTSRLEEVLGYVPSTSFAHGLAEFFEWARSEISPTENLDQNAESELRAKNLLRQAGN
jgi:dTDP-L-rhamnose 4-epimerase